VARWRNFFVSTVRLTSAWRATVLPCQIFASGLFAERLLMIQKYLKRTFKNSERLLVI
jgi:hypothetical protein